ncbi:cytochrome-c peroxidase [Methylocucumis oryzae]|uniref:cytochrome-c peroxidase n=1 Tax=Methylocucumis oryzae TaxID=1632867 RepID=UPI001EF9D8A8|nr:cytochrome c peroxidase [Methylocucumis oryzae]
MSDKQQLGRLLFKDKNLSANRNQACETCHTLSALPKNISSQSAPAFVDRLNVKNSTPVSLGSIPFVTGKLNTPSVGYAAFSPIFHWDDVEGLYAGGLFWNGRATDLVEQAKMPFLNPVEMAMPSQWAVVSRLKENAQYVKLFAEIYHIDLNKIPHIKNALFSQPTPAEVATVYTDLALAIAEFERSSVFNKFNSKFDFVMAGKTRFTKLEKLGMTLFNDENKGNCAACHPSEVTVDESGTKIPPLFTDFTYDNIGAPRNLTIPGNPEPDQGLGARSDIRKTDPERAELGKHKVMSLRNIAITPPYGHNGVFTSLEQITHFYNTRDVLGTVDNNQNPNFGVTGWPKPEVAKNVNTDELGNLGLTDDEEKAIVAFLKTLTDDYPEWGNDPLVPPGTPSPFSVTP